ncbi:translation initiation factor eIF2B gamma subunit [Schizosaccharomyces pombe]|uniref:Translation initiation factor eIF2B subunit gamma n=1 Tax=Schizosaccharomyces pombe (strain 972 / ATCC 24843) TaxID=284812 RepID=EI2BG_SCHPO|nr:putative translation initiation factor eIF2B gamma subunit tif223 [Schizosaccharomyces pombe]P56288.2 RecName: Full=Translation initiation factor eIF2B subunit gamma; AltName: Full=eIF2B GDP-GTP exchange factor subunit gamma [Schizosaccharomyces pombe 972h-]CAB11281.2 translation initiation factor eIF2B gamma subunit (predicted) [Schizosaccharomyces pombe]|eukprot:NP_594962.2 putative translation initiation factor eIF2B gamma subunit tif223 [Schizosaccharomyces pombe]
MSLYEHAALPLASSPSILGPISGGRNRGNIQLQSIPIEFQAVVFAGFGNSLYPLTGSDALPKALLPIGNKPMLHYPLYWLEAAGFTSAILICMEEAEAHINAWLRSGYEGHMRIHVEAPTILDDSKSSADALRAVSHLIKNDFVCLSCDSIVGLPPIYGLDKFRLDNPSALAVYSPVLKYEHITSQSKEIDAKQLIGIEEKTSRLLYAKSSADVGSDFTFRMSLLWKHPRVTLNTNLSDAHIFVFKHWVIDLIREKESISSIRGDLIPYLVKCQYQKSFTVRENIQRFLSSPNNIDNYDGGLSSQEIKINALIAKDGIICSRANNLPNYFELNKCIAKLTPEQRLVDVTVSERALVGADCMVNEGTTIKDNSNIKKSIIGKNCVIGKGVVVSNSILMDNIVVEDGVRLESCIVASGAQIGAKSKLRECEIGVDHRVEAGRIARGERLVDMEKIETDMD